MPPVSIRFHPGVREGLAGRHRRGVPEAPGHPPVRAVPGDLPGPGDPWIGRPGSAPTSCRGSHRRQSSTHPFFCEYSHGWGPRRPPPIRRGHTVDLATGPDTPSSVPWLTPPGSLSARMSNPSRCRPPEDPSGTPESGQFALRRKTGFPAVVAMPILDYVGWTPSRRRRARADCF